MPPLRIGINAIFRGKPTGAANYIINLVNAITRMDKENQYFVFVTESNRNWFAWDRNNIHEVLCSVKTESPLIRRMWELFVLPRIVRKNKLDILHCPTNIVPPFIRCRAVVTFLDCQFFHPSIKHSFLRRTFNRVFMRRSFRKSHAIMTISNSVKDEILNYFGNRHKAIHVTHLGHDFNGSSDKEADSHPIGQKPGLNRRYILFVGFPHHRKNLVRLVNAFAIARSKLAEPYDLVLCGDFNTSIESDWPNILKAIEELGIKDIVRFVDYPERADLWNLIANAQMLAFLSLYEGFGLPVVEAMACGTPVLTSDIPVMHEIAGDAGTYVDPYNVDDIAEGMCNVLSDDAIKNDLSIKGRRQAARFTWENTAEKTLECYRGIGRQKTT
jgi:glycosyltransferase involved in cell wall biosynthesis